MDYSTKQSARLLRAARQDIMALQQMPDPAVSYDIKAASHHARRAYNALDTLKSCLHMSTAYSSLLQAQIDRLYLTEDLYVGAGA